MLYGPLPTEALRLLTLSLPRPSLQINTTVSVLFRSAKQCDANKVAEQLEVLLCAAALNLGQSWWTGMSWLSKSHAHFQAQMMASTVASQVFTLANFYLSTWEEYHTGVCLALRRRWHSD